MDGRLPSRTAIFGGTFDPVHPGHLLVAREVLHRLDYERVVFVPARISPHKTSYPAASGAQRVAMLEIAIADESQFEVDRCELDRDGHSYTIDTVRYLLGSGTVEGKPGLIVGADQAADFDAWREVDEIERLCDIILVRRPGYDGSRMSRRHLSVDNPESGISSTELRRVIGAGLPYAGLLAPGVARYIELNGLYR